MERRGREKSGRELGRLRGMASGVRRRRKKRDREEEQWAGGVIPSASASPASVRQTPVSTVAKQGRPRQQPPAAAQSLMAAVRPRLHAVRGPRLSPHLKRDIDATFRPKGQGNAK